MGYDYKYNLIEDKIRVSLRRDSTESLRYSSEFIDLRSIRYKIDNITYINIFNIYNGIEDSVRSKIDTYKLYQGIL